jgi:hypothetical protein
MVSKPKTITFLLKQEATNPCPFYRGLQKWGVAKVLVNSGNRVAFIVILCRLAERSPAGVTDHIAIIVKATDIAFWLYGIVGALNYSLDNPDQAKVSWYGPKSETVIDRIRLTNPPSRAG